MSAPLVFPTSFAATAAALDHADRAASAVVSRLTYAQDTPVARRVVTIAGRRHAAITVGGRYVLWPAEPAPMRFGRIQTVRAETCRWQLGVLGSGGALPELAVIGIYEGLKEVLKALVRELLADRFLPLRHRVRATSPNESSPARRASASPAPAGAARAQADQASRSMWWFWR
ncbi:MAG TPA: hypothetical protein VEL07_05010 [Planctomycetota bacterium]|nr:hypothetical protein [Planctomycetota bacterium]